ncbi:MAG: nucleoside transporter C-terminal domain-containing protein [Gammaproteobacteria bacterium]|jgi:CNT family concentrative nucleoside transporter
MLILQSAIGLTTFMCIAWVISENRRAASWRVAVVGIALQIVIAAALLRVPQARFVFVALNEAVLAVETATAAGTSFVFGFLGGAELPYEEVPGSSSLVFAFRSLPLLILVSALTSLLTYWRILPWIVRGFSALLSRTLGVGGAVALSAAANVFVGMVEAPLFIRSWLGQLSRGELFMVMSTGMATIAGTVLFLYTSILADVLPGAVGHLVTASLISAPAAISAAWLMIPPEFGTAADTRVQSNEATGAMDAITQGTQQGLKLYLNIIAMLIVLIALVELVNIVLTAGPDVAGEPLTMQRMLGWLMAPVAWLMGVPWAEATQAGSLLGIKTILNEFLAYIELARLAQGDLSPRTTLIMTYALCGMANLGSVGIMIGGFAALIPERRAEVTELAMKSIVGGTIATCCTGAVVGIVGA